MMYVVIILQVRGLIKIKRHRQDHLVIAALHDVLLEADWVLDVHVALHLMGGQPFQLGVEFCYAVLGMTTLVWLLYL